MDSYLLLQKLHEKEELERGGTEEAERREEEEGRVGG